MLFLSFLHIFIDAVLSNSELVLFINISDQVNFLTSSKKNRASMIPYGI